MVDITAIIISAFKGFRHFECVHLVINGGTESLVTSELYYNTIYISPMFRRYGQHWLNMMLTGAASGQRELPWWRHQMETFSASFVRGIHRSPVNSPHKGQPRGVLMFSLICTWINGCVNNREAGGLRRHRAHFDVTVMAVPRDTTTMPVCTN